MPELISQILDLKDKDVFLETDVNDTKYFNIDGLPRVLSYGKHPFSITFNDPVNEPILKNLSNIIFEFVDSRGVVIFSNLVDISELSGAGNGFVWIKKDPRRTADEIADGPAFFYIMGELGGDDIPSEWKNIYNIRSTFKYDIRKDYPNTSPLFLKSPLNIQTNLNISESIELDADDSIFKRSFINVTLSDLETVGGKIEAIELAYNEQKAKTDDFEVITSYPLTSGSFETDDQTATSGLNPITNTTKIITPKQFRRDTPVKFRLRFLNPSKQLAQHLDEDRQGEVIEVTSSFVTFGGSPFVVEKKDNLLKGSMFTGNAVGKGFEQSGKSSAFLKTVDYEGFLSASSGQGSSGIMFFSGSVLTSSGDNYDGVGLEMVADSESFFRFRSNPSIFDVRAKSFFVGSDTTQFISGSNEKIEISSSLFHLNPSTNTLTMSGSISASGGKIGGWDIRSNKLVNSDNTVELNSGTPGLNIKDAGGTERVSIKSGSFLTIGEGTQYIQNKSFEDDSISAGRNIVTSATSWSFSLGGKVSASLTDRSGFADQEKAVSGDNTLDIIVPSGTANYTGHNNTYEIVQIITSSFNQGDTLSFSSVARFSSSFGGKGKDRALGPQYFRLEYSSSTSNGFKSFLPANDFTASNGYAEYFLGSGQYNSFGASAEMPEAADFVKLILTGSINDDTGYTIKKPLFAERKRNKDLGNRIFSKQIKGSTTAEFPETELTWDNFSLRSNSRKVELTEKGLLIYNSEDSFIKMDASGIEFRGGSGVTTFGQSINRESFTNDSQVAGTLGAPALQPYSSDPEDIGITAFDGNVGEFAKGNHRHRITAGTIKSVLSGESVSLQSLITTGSITANGNITTTGDIVAENYIVRSTETQITTSFSSGSTKFGDTLDDTHEFTGSLSVTGSFLVNGGGVATTPGNNTEVVFNDGGSLGSEAAFTYDKTTNHLSASLPSTASFGKILQNGETLASVGGADTNVLINTGGVISGSGGFVYDDSTNRVGIGTTSPEHELQISATNPILSLKAGTDKRSLIEFENDGTGFSVGHDLSNNGTHDFFIHDRENSGTRLYINNSGNIGIGTESPKTHLDVQSFQADGITIGADNDANRTRTNSTTKSGGITGVHYTNAEESIRLLGYSSTSDTNGILIGGGNGDWNAATKIDFYTAANFNTLTGTKTLTIAPNTISGSSTSTGSFGHGYIDSKLGIGTTSPDTLLHLKSTSASKPILTIENEQGGSNPTALRFKRVTNTPADADNIGQIEFRINNDNDEDILYSHIQAIATDVSDSTEDGKLDFFTMKAGTSTRTLTMESGQVSVTDHFSIAATKAIFLDGGSNTFIRESSSDNIEFATNNTVRLDINNTAAIFKQPNYKISGSSTSTGSFGRVNASRVHNVKRLEDDGGELTIRSDDLRTVGDGITIKDSSGSDKITFALDSTPTEIGGAIQFNNALQFASDLGTKISGSSTSTGSFGNLTVANDLMMPNGRVLNWGTSHGTLGSAIVGNSSTNVLVFYTNGSERARFNSSGNLGIGITSPDGLVHAFSGNASQTANAAANQLIAENNTNAGVSILSGTSHSGAIYFGDSGNAKIGTIIYDHGDEQLRIGVNDAVILTLTDSKISGSATSTGSFGSLTLGESSHIHTLSIKGRTEATTGIRVRHPSDDTLFEVKASEDDGRLRLFANNSRKIQLHANDVSYFNGGNVGIGTESPEQLLHLRSEAPFIAITDSSNNSEAGVLYRNTSGTNVGFAIYDFANNALKFRTNNNLALTIDSSGNLEFPRANLSGSLTSTGSFGSVFAGGTGLNSFVGNVVVGSSLSTSSDTSLMIGDSGDTHLRIGEDSNNNARMSWDASENSLEFHLTDGGSARSNVLVLDSTGFVGIGTASPDRILEVETSAHTYIRTTSGGTTKNSAIEYTDGTNFFYSGFMANESGVSAGEFSIFGTNAAIVVEQGGDVKFGVANQKISGSSTSTGSFGRVDAHSFQNPSGLFLGSTNAAHEFSEITSTNHLFIGAGASTVQMQNDLIPDGNGSQDLGSSNRNFNQIFAKAKVTGSAISTGSFGDGRIANKLGIGTTSPSTKLHTVGTGEIFRIEGANSQLRIDNSTTDVINLNVPGSGDSIRFSTVSTTAMNIDSSQNVGIGTTNPGRKLEVKDSSSNVGIRLVTGTALDAIIDFGDTDDGDAGRIQYDNNTDKMHFRTNASDRLTIDSSGKVGIGISNPQVGLDIHADTTETVAVFGQADDGDAYIATRVGEVQNRRMGYIFQVGSAAVAGYGSANTTATITSHVLNDGGTLKGDLRFSTNKGDSLQRYLTITDDGQISGSSTTTGSFGAGRFSEKVGIGTTSPIGHLEIIGEDGTVSGTPDGDARELVIRNDHRAGISIIAGEGSGDTSNVIFGSTSDMNGASVNYDFNSKLFRMQSQHASAELSLASANNVEAVRIDTSQRVGIGTSNPSKPLTVAGEISSSLSGNNNSTFRSTSGGARIILDSTTNETTTGIRFAEAGAIEGSIVYDHSDDSLDFRTGGSDATRMTIDNGGDVLIATNDAKIKADSTNTLNIQAHQLKILGSGGEERFQLQSEGNSNPGVFMIKQSEETTTVQLNSDGVSYLNGGNVGIGTSSPDFKLQVDGTIAPESDNSSNLGSASLRWADVFAVQTTTGGVFETGLKTEKIGDNPTGTIVSWKGDGLFPCDSNEDELVMGVIKQGKDEPIVMGAEPVLVTGKVDIGDYIVTSDKIGHGKSVKRGYLLKKDLFGKVIAQALESSDDSDSCLIKCMIRKM